MKAECLQVTGSFKVRGAAVHLEALDDGARARGVITCSSGNHGRAVAWVAGRLGIPAEVFVPEWVDPVKKAGIEAAGAKAVLAGATFDESERLARERAGTVGGVYVSAYDDAHVIAGQGTLGFEIVEQLGVMPSAVLVPLSGGGLAGGIASALGTLGPPSGVAGEVVAISAVNAGVMRASLDAGRPVELPELETLANALAGGIGLDNRHSFALVRDLVRVHRSVSEESIAAAMRYAVERLRLVVEGGGAVGLAALLSGAWTPDPEREGPVVVLLSGGNVDANILRNVLSGVASSA